MTLTISGTWQLTVRFLFLRWVKRGVVNESWPIPVKDGVIYRNGALVVTKTKDEIVVTVGSVTIFRESLTPFGKSVRFDKFGAKFEGIVRIAS